MKKVDVIRNTKNTDDKVHEVCRLLSMGIKSIEIHKMTHISLPLISSIKHRRKFLRISYQYDFK